MIRRLLFWVKAWLRRELEGRPLPDDLFNPGERFGLARRIPARSTSRTRAAAFLDHWLWGSQ